MDLQAQIVQLGREIATEFKSRVGALQLSADQSMLVERSAQRLALVSLSMLAADPAARVMLAIQRDAALASLENVGIAQMVQAEQIMRQTVYDVIAKALKLAMGILAAGVS